MTIQDRLRRFIVEELQPGLPQGELTDDYPLLQNRVIDSMGILEVVTYVEGEFGVRIDDEELVNEHFGTIGGIARLVESKRAAIP